MRIIQVIYSLTQGGAERLVIDLSNELSKSQEVFLITLRNDQEGNNGFYRNEISDQINYINFPLKRGFRVSDLIKVKNLILEINPDIIHAHSNTVYYFLPLALISRKIKIFHTIHNDAFFDGRLKIASSLRKYFYKFKRITPITISEKSNESFHQYYNLNVAKLIYNGRKQPLKSLKFKDVEHEVEDLKNKHEDLVFIHISRFNENQKNHKLLLTVFNNLCKKYSNLLLLIVGRDFDKPDAQFLQSIKNSKTFFLGNKNNVIDYLNCSDAFCLSSNFEGLPISLLEALACGVVPVCTPVGGITDVIVDEQNGFLSQEISEASYYNAMKKFIQNPERIKKRVLIDLFKNEYSIEACAYNHIKLYENTLNS